MKFGKEFRIHLEETMPEWRDKFLCYKVLKKLLKNIPPFPLPPLPPPPQHRQEEEEANDPSPGPAAPQVEGDGGGNHQYPAIVNHVNLQDWFVRILDEELEKFNDFYVDKEEEFVIRLQDLKERIENMNAKNNETGVLAENERSEEMLEIRKAFVTIHGEMVLLKNYSSLNFAALVKILKKYDKRTGDLLRLPFTQRALNQPFFTTEPLTSLVRECEANLELLFPVEAEVIEPTRQSDPQCTTQARAESSIHEGNADVYRGTLAAMRAIQGLRGASSTYNPLSLGQFFHDQDGDDGSGALTAESSLTNSPADSHKGNHDEPPSAEGAEITVAPLEKT